MVLSVVLPSFFKTKLTTVVVLSTISIVPIVVHVKKNNRRIDRITTTCIILY